MKMYLLQQILRIGLFGVVLASSSGQTLQNSKIIKTSSGKNGVTVEVSVPDIVSAGQPVVMVVNLTNAGSQPLSYVRSIPTLGIHLVNSNKVPPEMTPLGKISIDIRDFYSTPPFVEMKPGEHYEWRVDLGTLFILKPGKYQVSVKPELFQLVPREAAPFVNSTDPLGFVVQ